jgi:hypothetical protein
VAPAADIRVGAAAEHFTALGVDIKRRSPFKHTYVAELANDWVGYLPDRQGHGLGGYQTWTALHSHAEVGTGERMADEVVALLDELAAADTSASAAEAPADSVFDELRQQYQQRTAAVLKEYCLDCHSTDAREGELDLERFASLDDVRRDPPAWQKVAEMLVGGEMPPEDSPQPTDVEMTQLSDWTERYLDAEARAAAGDPGPVVLRRLNNAEYTYTVRDLTGVPLSPAREFPVDGAAGEGFTNTGSALSMSPSLVSKYLDAGKDIANHAVLLPDGIRFSPSTTRRDWTNEIMASIRSIYLRHTGRLGSADSLNHWDVTDPTSLTDTDGRVDLETYFNVLLRERERWRDNIDAVEEIARDGNLSAPYLRRLAEMLSTDDSSSSLLSHVRHRFDAAAEDDAGRSEAARSIAAEIRAWQERLWTFNPVGHFGQVKPWQEAVSPLAAAQSFRVKLEPTDGSEEIALYLVTASAGDVSDPETVVWQSPRIERPGRPPIMLRDLRATSVALQRMRERALPDTAKYLAAAFQARTEATASDVSELSRSHDVDPIMLRAWLAQLGIDHGDEFTIKEYLHAPLTGLAGHALVNGWMVPGLGDLSLAANASDDKVNVPGDLNPHSIVVHPRPERWVAVGWKSPMTGRVRLAPSVKDAHATCGNGVSWSFELRRRSQCRVLGSGNVDLGGVATIEPIEDIDVQKGDLVSLVISARDHNHGCDLTEIDLAISELDRERRDWSLAGDCADSIQAGNPHADPHGNAGVWHFYTGLDDDADAVADVRPDSLLARWFEAAEAKTADAVAVQIAKLLSGSSPEELNEADAALHRQLTALDGPLFSRIDTAALAETLSLDALSEATYGLDPMRFGRHLDPAVPVVGEHLVVTSPSIVKFTMPKALVAGAEFVVSGVLGDAAAGQASMQLLVTTEPPPSADALLAGVPVVVSPGSTAEARFRQSFDDFREIFPAAMCYPRIVPVDVVVTLVLFHREDEPLSRLMLSADESGELDRLWDQLQYVSQDALAIVTGFEQLLEFASQDDDPSKYEPLGEAIRAQAQTFRQRLIETEPRHVDALIDFASRAYRRPLADDEVAQLRTLYADLRDEELSHDEALRLTLARVLTAPAFLYRLEWFGPGAEASPVSGDELASRLSYFLWSTAPDAELSRLAASGELLDTDVLLQQTDRMLRDDRVRRLAIEFACQWLHVRQFDELAEKNEQYFPEFADLRGDMYEETVWFFTDLFQHDGSLLDVFGADHTFLNERLARHYGVPNVTGDEWRRVDGVGRYSRGGILAQATTLAEQSGASRTSPILRGNWVSETLLGERSPRPPKGVPPLAETVPSGLTERQMIERHSSDVSCAKCHTRIDPYGFALESFDAIGRYREVDAGNRPIDTRTTLVDGAGIEGIEGLRQYLLTTRRRDVLGQMCRKLLGYALGRAVQLSDEPLLNEMLVRLEENEYRFSTAVRTIILSKQFRMIRGRDYCDGAVASAGEPLEPGTATASTVGIINREDKR